MKKFWMIILCVASFWGCSNGEKPCKIAIDKSFLGYDLQGQDIYLYGFIEDLLMEIAKEKKINFEMVDANWDSILDDLDGGKYDLIFSPLQPYNFNLAKYDFSHLILPTGPVLIVSDNSEFASLKKMSKKHVGVVKGENSILVLQKYSEIFPETYESLPQMLSDLQEQNIDGALVNFVPACAYLRNIYSDLKMINPPLSEGGLRIIARKNTDAARLNQVNDGLQVLKQNKKLNALKQKWGFCY